MRFPDRDETLELNATTRNATGGAFITLAEGITHYERGGNESAPVTVLVHGFSVPSFIYDPTFRFLVEAGQQPLRYDLFGRGFSDRPDQPYKLDLFINQLTGLLDALRLTQPVNLIGLSMGGPIASAFALRHRERVRRLVLIDPAGVKPVAQTLLLRLVKLPFAAEAALSVVGGEALVKSVARDFFDPALIEHFIGRYRVQMQYRGFKRALLSTVRNGMLGSFAEVYAVLGKTDLPVLLFWGREDTTTPFANAAALCRLIPHLVFHPIANCGHIPHYEQPESVNPILLRFLTTPPE